MTIKYKAIYHFQAENEDELTFLENDIIILEEKLDDEEWARGKVQGSLNVGIFPLNFVQELPMDELDPQDRFEDSIKKLSSVNEEMQSPFDKMDHGDGNLISRFESNLPSSPFEASNPFDQLNQDENSPINKKHFNSNPHTATDRMPGTGRENSNESDKGAVEYVAMYDCDGVEDDELTFKKNDIIIFLNDDEDQAWMWGRLKNDKTNRKGIFPKNLVNLHTKKKPISNLALSKSSSISAKQELPSNNPKTTKTTAKTEEIEYIAMYDCDGVEDDELTFKKNDIIIFLNDDEDQAWMWGRLKNDKTNRKGIFPKNLVNLHTNKLHKDKCSLPEMEAKAKHYIAKFEFLAENDDELHFREGEVVCLIRKDTEEWWYGRIKDEPTRKGMFPSAYVKEFKAMQPIDKLERITMTPKISIKTMTIQEASRDKQTAIRKAREIVKKHKCGSKAATACEINLDKSTTMTEREVLLEALLGGSQAGEINELAEQARQMLLLVDNAIEQKGTLKAVENSMDKNVAASGVLNNLGKMDLTATVASAMKLYDDKERQKSVLMKQQLENTELQTAGTEEGKLQRPQQDLEETISQPVNVAPSHTSHNDTAPRGNNSRNHKIEGKKDDPSSWIPEEDPLDMKVLEDDSRPKAMPLKRDTIRRGSKNDYIDNIQAIMQRTPTPTPSIPTPSPTPDVPSKMRTKRSIRRHASIVFVLGEPGTREFKKQYQTTIFTKYIAEKVGCLHISVARSVKETLAMKGPVARDILKYLIAQKSVPRNIILKILFRDIRKAIDLFDKDPSKFQSLKYFHGSPTQIRYYDFIIEGFPSELEDINIFRAIATSIFSEGLDWRVAYLQSPNPRNIEKQRLQKHQWNALSHGRVEEAKHIRKQQEAFRARIQPFQDFMNGYKRDHCRKRHIAKGSKIGGKKNETSKSFFLGDFTVKGLIQKLATYVAGYSDTLDKKLEHAPDGFVSEHAHERGVQTTMSELPPKTKLSGPKVRKAQGQKQKKRIQQRKKHKSFEPFIRGGSPVHVKMEQREVRIDGKIRPRKRKYGFQGKRAQTVDDRQHGNSLIVEERNIHTAPLSLTLTEELWRWLRSLQLGSWSRIEEPEWWRHAFSNGYIFADILSKYFPRAVQTHMFDPLGVSSYSKRDNWGLLMKFFKKHRVNLIIPEKILPSSNYGNSTSIEKSLRSNQCLCDAAMSGTPNAVIIVLKGIYFFLLNLGLVAPLQNIYIPTKTPTPAAKIVKAEDLSAEKEMANKLIDALGVLKHSLQKHAHGKTHVDLRGFQGKKMTPEEFKRQLRTQLGVKLDKIEHELLYMFFDKDSDGTIDYVEVMHKFLHVHRMEVQWDEAFAIGCRYVKIKGSGKQSINNEYLDNTDKISRNQTEVYLPPAIPRGTPTKPSQLQHRDPRNLHNFTEAKSQASHRSNTHRLKRGKKIGYRKTADGQRILIKRTATSSSVQKHPQSSFHTPPPPPLVSQPVSVQPGEYSQLSNQERAIHESTGTTGPYLQNNNFQGTQIGYNSTQSSASNLYLSPSYNQNYEWNSQEDFTSNEEYISSDYNVQKLTPANIHKPESNDWHQNETYNDYQDVAW